MADGLEQPWIWWRRVARRRWLCLGVAWATCALGWSGVCLLAANQPAVAAGVLLSVVLLAGIAGGGGAALVAGREPVFDSVAELRCAFGRPVLGSVADLTSPWRRARAHIPFVLACLGLFALPAALLALRTWGSLATR